MDEFDILLEGIEDVYNMKLPNPSLILYFKNISKRKIWLDSDVCDILLDFEKYILHWNEEDDGVPIEDRKPIYIYIYTSGGDLNVTNSFIDIMKMSETPVYTVNMGRSMSAGALIFLAGKKRFVMPNSQILIHQGSVSGISGTTNQVFETIENFKKEEEKLKKYILENSKISEEVYDKNYKKEWFLTAQEAIEYGVADKIIQNIKELY